MVSMVKKKPSHVLFHSTKDIPPSFCFGNGPAKGPLLATEVLNWGVRLARSILLTVEGLWPTKKRSFPEPHCIYSTILNGRKNWLAISNFFIDLKDKLCRNRVERNFSTSDRFFSFSLRGHFRATMQTCPDQGKNSPLFCSQNASNTFILVETHDDHHKNPLLVSITIMKFDKNIESN